MRCAIIGSKTLHTREVAGFIDHCGDLIGYRNRRCTSCWELGSIWRRQVEVKKVLGAGGDVNRWRQSIFSHLHQGRGQSDLLRFIFPP